MARFGVEKSCTGNPTVLRRIMHRLGQWNCHFCAPNMGCNSLGKRTPRPDKYKSIRKGK